jgi:uncharacterized coiled-coil protein SlyX
MMVFVSELEGRMPTQEDRIAELEQKVAAIELERLYEQRKAEERPPTEQQWDFKQINHRLTMLLGIASGQEHDIKSMKNDVSALRGEMNQRFTSVEGKLEQVLQMLATLVPKADK